MLVCYLLSGSTAPRPHRRPNTMSASARRRAAAYSKAKTAAFRDARRARALKFGAFNALSARTWHSWRSPSPRSRENAKDGGRLCGATDGKRECWRRAETCARRTRGERRCYASQTSGSRRINDKQRTRHTLASSKTSASCAPTPKMLVSPLFARCEMRAARCARKACGASRRRRRPSTSKMRAPTPFKLTSSRRWRSLLFGVDGRRELQRNEHDDDLWHTLRD